jgi:hypothetical protein
MASRLTAMGVDVQGWSSTQPGVAGVALVEAFWQKKSGPTWTRSMTKLIL